MVRNHHCLFFLRLQIKSPLLSHLRQSIMCQCIHAGVPDPCATVRCRSGHRCEVFEPTGEAFCTPDCSLNNGGCARNEICTIEQVQCVRAPCPPVVQCLDQCSVVRCATGHRCEIYEPTGEAFCTPDCSLSNGGCARNEICTLQQVQCKRAPCPPVVQCLDQCSVIRCATGHRCEIYERTGEAFCTPDCSLNNGGCARNEICTLQQLQCFRAPCPPVVRCLDQCSVMRCRAGHRCEIHKPTGEAFCKPDCSVNNGGCRSDQICELRPVTCVSPPCPPEVQCSCPPTCTKEFCARNPRGLCSK